MSFNQLQSMLVSFNQFDSVKTARKWLTTGRWGKQYTTQRVENKRHTTRFKKNLENRLVLRLCRADLGWICSINSVQEILGGFSKRISPVNFLNDFFGFVSPGLQPSPNNSRPKLTPKIVGNLLKLHNVMFEPKQHFSRWLSAYN